MLRRGTPRIEELLKRREMGIGHLAEDAQPEALRERRLDPVEHRVRAIDITPCGADLGHQARTRLDKGGVRAGLGAFEALGKGKVGGHRSLQPRMSMRGEGW